MSPSSKLFAVLASLSLYSIAGQCGSLSLVSVSDSIFASVEGISNSVSTVSKSASKATNLAEGDYRVVEVAEMHDEAMRVRLALRPVEEGAGEGVYLYMRSEEFARSNVREGQLVSAKLRPYGVAIFGKGGAEPFALVLNEQMSPQIRPVPVTL